MKAFIIVATKGRARETGVLLDYLARQSLAPQHTLVVGSEPVDLAGLDTHPLVRAGRASLLQAPAGLTRQRNAGLDALVAHTPGLAPQDWFVAFFDDDFRPAHNWLEQAAKAMQGWTPLVGLTGHVLADGVKSEFGIDEALARQYLDGSRPAEPHRSNVPRPRLLTSLYGCNMAFRGTVASQMRFDEQLPLYGWQEDYDFGSRARQHGVVALFPRCRGVHLGTSSGRTSGVRFGYSQISNPIYLARKGSMSWRVAGILMSKNLLANLGNTVAGVRTKDFPGRLRGNARAFAHLLAGKLDPLRVLEK